MKILSSISMIALGVTLIGCGSGGGGGGSSASNPPSQVPTKTEPQLPTTPPTSQVESEWKAKIREAKLIRIDHETLRLSDDVAFPSQIFNMADEKLGKLEQELGRNWVLKAYNLPYSAVGYVLPADVSTDEYGRVIDSRANNYMAEVVGARTEILPKGSAHYEGVSFGANSEGKLKLSINFSDKTISGSVTDRKLLSTKEALADISLKEANISAVGEHHFSGVAESQGIQGSYYGSFFGPNAEEVGGIIRDDAGNKYEGFSGTK
ncbi:transferrin-binding protein-like solute binding protein [Glaesserella parasuis]|uniref:ABC-type antimicrobial peptide transport system, ATPase component n=1 Tax=Glaesserella parasuis serovar 5 (strain SH0165) TaxID=557723 RepID=B8F5D8_GLAP5|nr:factor H binding protein domain-containing protein [Glaesserella parasuis]ACL32540.1 ABC-type antimicrobial peptide transport system, ATPase component [Glaesserella parasuis SH0165]MDG6237861.1 transferrin-binding protein-like solute binding protein [Glaesserella parasuis]MDG6869011.1 transferrin-binding protein-like solute binding protein [Glaesserella parasuis]MDO9924844.1 transferrin-binding protein-like solute binding protein [Glaesserella parasuis]MDP0054647.1 transferrin-binding prote